MSLPKAFTRSLTETPWSSGGISGRRLSTRSGGGGFEPGAGGGAGPLRAPVTFLSLSVGFPNVGHEGGLPDA